MCLAPSLISLVYRLPLPKWLINLYLPWILIIEHVYHKFLLLIPTFVAFFIEIVRLNTYITTLFKSDRFRGIGTEISLLKFDM